MLNALRRHCGLHLHRRTAFAGLPLCSTPCGVTVVCTSAGSTSPVSRVRCSTPCGVTVVCTPAARRRSTFDTCAQRLAASLWSALGQLLLGRVTRLGCSTPCGVTESVTHSGAPWPPASAACAQRLAASLWSARRRAVPSGTPARCSTPCGVTVVCTPASAPRGRRPAVLNALRRHCGLHTVPAVELARVGACSTPCGVTVVCTRCQPAASTLAGWCSTPCGVTVVCTAPRRVWHPYTTRAQRLAASLWSAHFTSCPPSSRAARAQRLAASLWSARGVELGQAPLLVCSTPCGVTVVCTPMNAPQIAAMIGCSTPCGVTVVCTWRFLCGPVRPRRVLNALRRHCGLHGTTGRPARRASTCAQRLAASLWSAQSSSPAANPRHGGAQRLAASLWSAHVTGTQGLIAVWGAQRLAASLWSARPQPSPAVAAGVCAQRLAASLWSAREHRHRHRPAADVLNALRRHCGLHLAALPERVARRRVLNALRRHCGLHPPTPVSRPSCSSAQRLAASLWSAHGVGGGVERPPQCSTPCGVTVVCTACTRRSGRRPGRAQRLAASLWSAPAVTWGQSWGGPGAQRLAASLWSALRGRRHQHLRRHVLNALRRHCGLHSGASRSSSSGPRVLNALRRHCGLHVRVRRGRHLQAVVLNALRRHCGLHRICCSANLASFWCSTPCGVTVVCTRPAGVRSAEGEPVLNALRRHCGLHIPGRRTGSASRPVLNALRRHCGLHARRRRTRRTTRACAQRLAASLWSAPPVNPRPASTRRSAQRLAASLWSAPRCRGRCARRRRVLNALRRHCGLHLMLGGDLAVLTRVLNALRRHCGLHAVPADNNRVRHGCSTPCGVTVVCTSSSSGPNRVCVWCSTPCGVTVVCTPGPIRGPLRYRVLNALRRHCGLHVSVEVAAGGRRWCSTPCGVTVVCTR